MQNTLPPEEEGKRHKIAETVQHKTCLRFSIDGCQHLHKDMLDLLRFVPSTN